jgi:hypothetical protein
LRGQVQILGGCIHRGDMTRKRNLQIRALDITRECSST